VLKKDYVQAVDGTVNEKVGIEVGGGGSRM
jgi:hypothetical protein